MTETVPQLKKLSTARLLWFFFGFFGAHNFYLNRTSTGLIVVTVTCYSIIFFAIYYGAVTLGLTFIWWIYSGLNLKKMVEEENHLILHDEDY